MSRVENVIRNTIWGNINKIASLLLPFAIRTIIIKVLGDQYVGIGSLFTSILSVLNLADLGFSSAIVFSMYRPIAEGDQETVCALLRFYRKVYLWVGIVISVVGAALIPFIPYFIKGDVPADINIYCLYVIYLFNTVITYFIYGYKVSLFYANQRIDQYSKIIFCFLLIQYALQAAVLLLLKNYYYYTIVHTLVVIPQCLFIGYKTKKLYPQYMPRGQISHEQKSSIYKRVSALLGHKIGGTIILSIDSILISTFLGLTVLGIYSNYYYILSSVIGIINIIIQSTLPVIGNKLVCDNSIENKKAFFRLHFLWNWIVSFCATSFLCLFQPFIRMWLGEDHLLPMYVVIVLSAYFYAWQFRVMGLNFKDAAGLWKQDWPKPYIGMAANLGFSILIVILTKDVIGVLIPTICVMAGLYYPWETRIIFKSIFKCNAKSYYIRCLFFLALTIIHAAGTYAVCTLIPEHGLGFLLIKGILCLLIPNIILGLAFCRTDEFKYYKSIIGLKMKSLTSTGKH